MSAPAAASLRLFFACEPPPPLIEALHAVARSTGTRFGGRVCRPDTIHLTLAFLGQVPAERLAELCRLAAALPFRPFDLRLDELALWHHNRLLWAGCRHLPEALAGLAADLRGALLAAAFPCATGHAFKPHLTLLRNVPARSLPLVDLALPALPPLDWRVDGYTLIASELRPEGPRHTPLARFPAAAAT